MQCLRALPFRKVAAWRYTNIPSLFNAFFMLLVCTRARVDVRAHTHGHIHTQALYSVNGKLLLFLFELIKIYLKK